MALCDIEHYSNERLVDPKTGRNRIGSKFQTKVDIFTWWEPAFVENGRLKSPGELH